MNENISHINENIVLGKVIYLNRDWALEYGRNKRKFLIHRHGKRFYDVFNYVCPKCNKKAPASYILMEKLINL